MLKLDVKVSRVRRCDQFRCTLFQFMAVHFNALTSTLYELEQVFFQRSCVAHVRNVHDHRLLHDAFNTF